MYYQYSQNRHDETKSCSHARDLHNLRSCNELTPDLKLCNDSDRPHAYETLFMLESDYLNYYYLFAVGTNGNYFWIAINRYIIS
jgi:hypothetical protein